MAVFDGHSLCLAGELLGALPFAEGIVILVQPNENSGTQNLFFYDWDGKLKWQVPQRERFPNLAYQVVREAPNSQLYAIVTWGGTRVTINRMDGSIVREEEWKE